MKKFILFLSFILVLTFGGSSVALARAGGGGGGGSGSSYHSSNSSYGRTSTSSTVLFASVFNMIFIYLFVGKQITEFVHSTTLDNKSRKDLKKLSQETNLFDYRKIDKNIENNFFIIQDAWCKNNYSIAINHMTENIYKKHKAKLSWMTIRNEVNIMENLKLKSIKIVEITENLPNNQCTLLIRIKASAFDYIINTKTNEIDKDKVQSGSFIEYWKYRFVNGKWILNNIYQQDEIDINNLQNKLSSRR